MPFRFASLRLLPLKDGLQRPDRPQSLGEASRDGKNLQHPADRVNGWFMAALPGTLSGVPRIAILTMLKLAISRTSPDGRSIRKCWQQIRAPWLPWLQTFSPKEDRSQLRRNTAYG